MPNVSVDFEVTGGNGTQAFWIAVDKKDVRLTHGEGSVDLKDDEPHSLVWWFTGNPGGTLSIVGKVGKKAVVEIKDDKIPQKKKYAGGFKHFNVA
jgi:hypothetical protein